MLPYKNVVAAVVLLFSFAQAVFAEAPLKPPKAGKAIVILSAEASGTCLPSYEMALQYIPFAKWYHNTALGMFDGPKHFVFKWKERGSDPRIENGWFIVKEISARGYNLTQLYADGAHALVHRQFQPESGKIYYLGAITMDLPECGLVDIAQTDKSDRDLAIFREKHPELASAEISFLSLDLGKRGVLDGKQQPIEGSLRSYFAH